MTLEISSKLPSSEMFSSVFRLKNSFAKARLISFFNIEFVFNQFV